MLAAGLSAWLVLSTEDTLRSLTLLLVVPAGLLLAAGLAVRRPIGVPLAVFLLGVAYALRLLAEEDALDQRAPLVAAALFALAELSYWSLEALPGISDEAGAALRRLGLLALLMVGVVVLGVALLALVEVTRTGGSVIEAIGFAAAAAALALLVVGSRQAEPER